MKTMVKKQKGTPKPTPRTLDELDSQTLPPKRIPRTLDALFGDNGMSKFGTVNQEEFEDKLESLSVNKIDIEQYATNHGLRSNGNVNELKRKLLAMFQSHVNQFKNLKVVDTLPKKVNTKELRKLMADGR